MTHGILSSLPRRPRLFQFLLLAALGALVYGNSLRGEFVFDDIYNIRENPFVQSLRFFPSYFTDAGTLSALPENAPYRPLSTLSFALLWWVGQGAVWIFHLYKIILHVLIAWISLQLCLRLTRDETVPSGWTPDVALLGAAVFVVHPALSESVNYISSLTTVQAALFFVLAFWAYLEKKPVAMAVFAFASMLTKEEGAVFPVVVLLHSWLFEGLKDWRKSKAIYLVSAGTLFVYLAIRLLLGSKTVLFGVVSRDMYFYTQLRAWSYYLYKIFTPWGYSVEHHWFGFSRSLLEPAVFLSAMLILALSALAFFFRSGARNAAPPAMPFAWGWYLGCLLPASSFFVLSEPINEHRYYLSFTLFLPLLVMAVSRAIARLRLPRQLLILFSLVVLVILGASTRQQNSTWRTAESLWSDVVRKDPSNGRALNNLGSELLGRGRTREALELFTRAEQVLPGYKYALINQVTALQALGRLSEARQAVQKMVTASDGVDTVVVHYAHAKFLYEVERSAAKTLPVLERCNVVSSRKYIPCLSLLIWVYQDLNRVEEMMKVALEVQRLQPGNRDGRFGQAMAFVRWRKYAEARDIFDSLTAANPKDVQALHNSAWTRFQLNDLNGARELWKRKLELVPGDAAAISYLSRIESK